MGRANIYDLKTHFSRHLSELAPGEVLTICKNNLPVAELRRLPEAANEFRPIGLAKGKIQIHPGFFEPMDVADLDAWEGKS